MVGRAGDEYAREFHDFTAKAVDTTATSLGTDANFTEAMRWSSAAVRAHVPLW